MGSVVSSSCKKTDKNPTEIYKRKKEKNTIKYFKQLVTF